MRACGRPVREKQCALVGGRCASIGRCPPIAPPFTPTAPAWETPGRAAGPGLCPAASGPAARSRTPPTSGWSCGPCWRALGAVSGPVEVVSDSTYVVNCFRDRLVRGVAEAGLAQLQPQAGGQPRPMGAAHRGVPGEAGRDLVPVGQGPLRRRVERDSRPASRRRGHRPALPSRPLVPRRLVGGEQRLRSGAPQRGPGQLPDRSPRVPRRQGRLDRSLPVRRSSLGPLTASRSVSLFGGVRTQRRDRIPAPGRGPVRGRSSRCRAGAGWVCRVGRGSASRSSGSCCGSPSRRAPCCRRRWVRPQIPV